MLAIEQAVPTEEQTLLLLDPTARLEPMLHSVLLPEDGFSLRAYASFEQLEKHLHDRTLLLCYTHDRTALQCHIKQIQLKHPGLPIIIFNDHLTDADPSLLVRQPLIDQLCLQQLTRDLLLRSLRYAQCTRRNQDALAQLKITDPLTGVGNRQYFYQALLNELQQGNQLALITVDFDGFSRFNNEYGHDAGDEVVLELSRRLRRCSDARHLARIGSDEFALVLPVDESDVIEHRTKQLIAELIGELMPEYRFGDDEKALSCSIGVAFSPQHSSEFDTLIKQSGLARVRAKAQNGLSYAIYDQQHDQSNNADITLEPELWRALQKGEFVLHYQPRIDLRTGCITGAEALIRWQHPERGLIRPDDFIPACEKSGLIVPIGYWVIQQAGRDMKLIREAGLHGHIGVNLSFRQFQDTYLARTIERLIEQFDIDSSMLEFELTETALFSDEVHVKECIHTLSAHGIEFSLDDFGTGYSSFSLLQKLPITKLKIDKSFIAGVPGNADDEEIVRAIVSLAHNLQKSVIAEGVETKAQLEFLIKQDCDQVQGYFFSPPVSLDVFLRMLGANEMQAR
ncbi:diguanylate cyclase [Marinobacterium lacunae]|uniref:cyclic-guanylate-specific phosphodiesterase n=1 Tax=Marinobacterium lacunae TaxID=1232683 RepID=A0A081FYF8_9GAMM|nr:bifunctional diguanylate cyclase/phosphodiesterase [Marinobacterium lacunae]KEA63563.1 diguanylate cyclase [Marinobacterium lacunae]